MANKKQMAPSGQPRGVLEVGTPDVLQLIHSNEGGGVEALAAVVADGLTARGVVVRTEFLYPGFTATPLQKIKGALGAARLLARQSPPVVIAYQSTGSLVAGLAGLLSGCKTRIVHQTAIPSAIHPAVRILDKLAGTVGLYTVNVTNSATTAEAFAGYPSRYLRAIRRIDHGLDAPVARNPRTEVLRAFGVPEDGLILLTTGRLCEQKAQARAIRALPLIRNARLVIAGGGPDEAMLRALATELGVDGRVHFLGVVPRERIGDLLGAADVYVFTTNWETFGLAAVEAAMSGLAIAANDLPILREVLSGNGTTPVVFADAADPEIFAAAVEQLRDRAPIESALAEFAASSRAKYAKERMIDAYYDLLPESVKTTARSAVRRPTAIGETSGRE